MEKRFARFEYPRPDPTSFEMEESLRLLSDLNLIEYYNSKNVYYLTPAGHIEAEDLTPASTRK